MRGNAHVRLGGGPGETERTERPPPRLWPTQSRRAARQQGTGRDPPRGLERAARKAGNRQLAKELKGARFVLWKNAAGLTDRRKPSWRRSSRHNKRLYRAYLLAQQLRKMYRVGAEDALVLLEAWLRWARQCRLQPFRQARPPHHPTARTGVKAAFTNGPSNARVEQINTQPRLIIRRGSATTPTTPSSPRRCCHSAGSAHRSRAGDTTHGSVSRFQKVRRTEPRQHPGADLVGLDHRRARSPACASDWTPSPDPHPQRAARRSPASSPWTPTPHDPALAQRPRELPQLRGLDAPNRRNPPPSSQTATSAKRL